MLWQCWCAGMSYEGETKVHAFPLPFPRTARESSLSQTVRLVSPAPRDAGSSWLWFLAGRDCGISSEVLIRLSDRVHLRPIHSVVDGYWNTSGEIKKDCVRQYILKVSFLLRHPRVCHIQYAGFRGKKYILQDKFHLANSMSRAWAH